MYVCHIECHWKLSCNFDTVTCRWAEMKKCVHTFTFLDTSYKWINKLPSMKGNGGILVKFLAENNENSRTLPIKRDDRINIV